MKHIISLMLLSTTLTLASENIEKNSHFSEYLSKAVKSVEDARKDTLKTLNHVISSVESAREKNPNIKESTSTQIIETKSLATIARNTADVEIAKAHAMAEISKAVDALDAATPETKKAVEASSYAAIVNAIASVEIAKAKASKNIAKATGKVEISKTIPKEIPHPKETLTIAKNLSAVEIAKSVSDVEVAKLNSYMEIVKSSLANMRPTLSSENKKKLEDIKAQASAKISSYIAKLEVIKADIATKIAEEMSKVKIAESSLK